MEDLSLKDRTKMTKEEEYKGKYGDMGQAENLLKQKRAHGSPGKKWDNKCESYNTQTSLKL